jgi:ATP-binding cassette, subfamily C (CFTR/MRP), member 1
VSYARVLHLDCRLISNATAYLPQYLSSATTFAIFTALAARKNDTVNPERLFTALSLLLLLAQPLFNLYDGLYAFMSAIGCMHRIETFLNSEPRREARSFYNDSLDVTKGKDHVNLSLQSSETNRKCISVQGGNFGWSGDFQLRDVNFGIITGKIVFLLGPKACGKTTLLKAILGEVSHFEGSVELATSEIAFCEQSPWLMVRMSKGIRNSTRVLIA